MFYRIALCGMLLPLLACAQATLTLNRASDVICPTATNWVRLFLVNDSTTVQVIPAGTSIIVTYSTGPVLQTSAAPPASSVTISGNQVTVRLSGAVSVPPGSFIEIVDAVLKLDAVAGLTPIGVRIAVTPASAITITGQGYSTVTALADPQACQVTPPQAFTADDLTAACPSASEVQAFNSALMLSWDSDPSAPTLVCRASNGSADLTRLQERTYQALRMMQAFPVGYPLPWTDKSLYDWFTASVRGIRHRGDIPYSFCCEPAGVVNIKSNMGVLQSNSADTLATYMGLLVHEARHSEGLPHTSGGTKDRTLPELGAWGVQFYLYERMALYPYFFAPKDDVIAKYRSFFWRSAQMVLSSNICDASAGVVGSPGKVDFGVHTVGSGTLPRTVAFTEVRGSGARLGQISVTGPHAADFNVGVTASACENQPVTVSCMIPVTFRPTATGPRTATLHVSATSTAPAITVSLAGTGGREACNFVLLPVNARVGGLPDTGRFEVYGTDGCTWTATSSDTWLVPVSPTSGTGSGRVNYTVAPNTTGAPRQATIAVAGRTFAVSQNALPSGPRFAATGVVNAASYAGGITPGGLATIYGTGIATINGLVGASTSPLPRQLAGSVVEVDGTAMPITAVANLNSNEQINFQAPYSLTGRSKASLVVIANGARSPAIEVPVLQVQPGLFTMDGSSGAILHGGDYSLVSRANPAVGDEWVVVYLTGLGDITNQPGEGEPAPAVEPLARTRVLPVVRMGGIQAELTYAGLAPTFSGLYQLNVKVPPRVHGEVSVTVTAAGVTSPPTVIFVR